MKLLILLDYRSHFYSSVRIRGASLNLASLKDGFKQVRYEVDIKHFAEVDFRQDDYRETIVLYQSAEDPSLFYRDYIEDILLGLLLQGAILIPRFSLFRAHHNKVFMEIIRSLEISDDPEKCRCQAFGTYEEYRQFATIDKFPVVMKPSSGSKSHKVLIARNRKEADKAARKLSRTPSAFNLLLSLRNRLDRKGFTPISNHRHKFIVQRFIPNLTGDYKIVVYGEKYFVVFRENRPNDFRASGSGRLNFPRNIPTQVLNYTKEVFEKFNVPFASIDVGYDGETCYLFEFQFVMFGQYAVERSPWHFVQRDKQWHLTKTKTTAETELVSATHLYIKNNHLGDLL